MWTGEGKNVICDKEDLSNWKNIMGRFADTHRIFYKKGEVIKFLSFHLFCKLAIIFGQAIIETSKNRLDNCETPPTLLSIVQNQQKHSRHALAMCHSQRY